MVSFPLSSIGIIGLGQVGASLALAIQKAGLAEQLIGVDADEASLRYVQEKKIIDAVMPLEAMAQRCGLIIIATPPHSIGGVLQSLKPHLGEQTVVTDVASVKLPVLRYLEEECPEGINFIPSHPIAGGTFTGPQTATGDIFARKMCVLTPPQGVDVNDESLQMVQQFWQHLDMVIELMPADVHDLIYGYVSHLPHMLAYAASATLADSPLDPEHAPQTLFRFLRLGNSGVELWRDILLHNQAAVAEAGRTYLAMLTHIRGELAEGSKQDDVQEHDHSTEKCTVAETILFPRIAASCLIATVSILERQASTRLARYSGAGFADVASPASEEPEKDMEQISSHYQRVGELLTRYEKHLDAIISAVESGQPKQLESLLREMYLAHQPLRATLVG